MKPEDILEQMAPLFGLTKVYSENGWRWGYEGEIPDAKVQDHDYSWKTPTQAQVDALIWVCKRSGVKVPVNEPPLTWHWQVCMDANRKAAAVDAEIYDKKTHQLNVFELAEMVLMFPGGLGYSQLKSWIQKPPTNCPPNFPMAAAYLKRIVDSGYSEGEWFPAAKGMSNFQLLLLVDFKGMLEQISRHSLNIVSQSTIVLINLLTRGAMRNAKLQAAAQGSEQTKKCIHPECNEQVDLSKKKSGACCKDHMNFECTNPKCVARAQANGWARATHPFGTKIATEHWQFRKQ